MQKPPGITGTKRRKGPELAAWLEQTRPDGVGEAEFTELMERLAPVSESYLRKLLRESGARLAPVVEGVRQKNFDELEASLKALLGEYLNGDARQRALIRRLVVTAKDHARFAARREEKRFEKEEMVLWMITWLENPPLFPDWVRLRRKHQPQGLIGQAGDLA
jgi:hypothetical protein